MRPDLRKEVYILTEIKGAYGSVKVFTTSNKDTAIDRYALAQLQLLCDDPVSIGSTIRVMPDVHPGKVCTIGLTMTVTDRILPNLIGIDIGCGVSIVKLNNARMDHQKLDRIIRENIPAGSSIRNKPLPAASDYDLSGLRCYRHIREYKARLSLGTLGGGNHFIEVDQDEDGAYYLTVHSGSRHLGKEVTEHYLRCGHEKLASSGEEIPYPLTYINGDLMDDYIHDVGITQEYARMNRELILRGIMKGMKWKGGDIKSVCHNYLSESGGQLMLRKGAISAGNDEFVAIPVNMRDGIILGTGRGNPDWNYSAPHGAGRLLKREDVKNSHTVSEYKNVMKGIYSSCIGKDTLDEAPFAYRNIDEIAEAIKDTVRIDRIIRPVYSYKAGNEN